MKVLNSLIRGFAVVDRSTERLLWGARNVVRGYVKSGLTTEERIALTLQLYKSWFYPGQQRRGLFDWEEKWVDQALPSPPARVLVGAAGAGREVAHLLQAGYDVDAFEPVQHAYEQCRRLLTGRGTVVRATYDEFVRGGGELELMLGDAPYDAILLGWASLSHVFGADVRRQLLSRCAELAPQGPILASFMMGPNRREDGVALGRGEQLGMTLGRLHASLRGVDVIAEPVTYGSRFGLACLLSSEELEALAKGIGRRVVWGEEQHYPHASFVPR